MKDKEQYKKGSLVRLPIFGLGLIVEVDAESIIEEEESIIEEDAESIIEEDAFRVYWFKYRMISHLFKKQVVSMDCLLKKVINERK